MGIKTEEFSKSLGGFVGGIPNSLQETGEQWDFPNAWPPSVQMIIIGLANSESSLCKNESTSQGFFFDINLNDCGWSL